MSSEDIERQQKLLQLVKSVIQQDNELRLTLQIGDKFRFIRDRLTALLSNLEKNLLITAAEKMKEKTRELNENEIPVFVYLFNAHGATSSTWQKLLKPELFYEYSVNRPIYLDKGAVEAFIRSKANKAQHAYLTIIVRREALIQLPTLKDLFGSSIVKVKEGALNIENLISFTHLGKEYILNERLELIKKE